MIAPYQIVIHREFRRSLKLEVLRDKTVKITAPRLMPKGMIEAFIKRKENWIFKRLSQPNAPEWQHNTNITYLGQTYTLKFIEEKGNTVTFEGSYLVVTSLSPQKTLLGWFKKRALDILEDRVDHFSKQMNLHPQSLRIKTMKSRWGSCSSKGNLNFNWTLVMAPLPILDYVVIHELAHLKHMDHSKKFWALVASHCITYKVSIKWLKENAMALSVH